MLSSTKRVSIYIISDSLGETGEHVVRAAISQFDIDKYEIKRIPYITDMNSLKETLSSICMKECCAIFYTLVDNGLLKYLKDFATENKLIAVDLLSPVIETISNFTGLEPIREPGTIRRLDVDYFKRVEAIDFAVKYDDGKDPKGLLEADLILLGVSRTSKTPLSMYLANRKIKVANVPLVPETNPPEELFQVPSRKIVGLTNSPEKLNEIREERLKALGLPRGSSYASMERILFEIDYAENIMRKIGCPIIDVSNKAVEETAEIIFTYLKKNRVNIFKD